MSDERALERRQFDSDEKRWNVLQGLEDWLQTPMLVLSAVWLILVIVELGWGTTDGAEAIGAAIWSIFVAEFALRLALAPHKRRFLKNNLLTLIALAAPALRLLRIVRIVRFARLARGLRLVRIVGTANRSMNALRKNLRRRGLGYVLGTTALVVLLGAGGMLAFEPASEVTGGFKSYGDALWWTAMLITTMGTDFWPRTLEGRLLCFLLALYGFTMFGYLTASFASFFVGRDARSHDGDAAGSSEISVKK